MTVLRRLHSGGAANNVEWQLTMHRKQSQTICTLGFVLVFAGCIAARSPAAELERIREMLDLERGAQVADVGAGNGEFSEELARLVGTTGHVYSTEVDGDDVETIRERMDAEGLDNVTVILGDQHKIGLPENCCDSILLRLVYHHFTEPPEMRAALKRALRPGGRLVVIDIRPQKSWRDLPGVPDRGGHGVPLMDLIEEMTADGFEVVTQFDDWETENDDTYCVVFQH
jgi:ubiquinone/menaquinone biosynthesis C-methylase UbiE